MPKEEYEFDGLLCILPDKPQLDEELYPITVQSDNGMVWRLISLNTFKAVVSSQDQANDFWKLRWLINFKN